MNLYVVIEGEKAVKKLYQSWISYANKDLIPISDLREMKQNNVFILAGYGQPGYWGRVKHAIEDVNSLGNIDRLVISVDSEDCTYEDKLEEAKRIIAKNGCNADVRYVIQHFCLETWLLGNKTLFRKRPQDSELLSFMKLFDLRTNDPALLPGNKDNSWNRAQFAYRYLRASIRDIYGDRASYSKSNPGLAIGEGYFYQVKSTCLNNHHVESFQDFLTAFTQ